MTVVAAPVAGPRRAGPIAGATIARRDDRLIVAVLAAGFLVAVAGLSAGSAALLLIGGAVAGVGALMAAVAVPAVFVLAFIVVRPVVDIGPTYGHGPNVNTPLGALLLLALVSWAWQHRAQLSVPSGAALAAVLLATAGVLSVLGSRDVAQSATMALRLVTIAGLFVFAEQAGRLDPGYLVRVVIAVLMSVVAAAIVGAAQLVGLVRLPIEVGFGGFVDAQEYRVGGPYPAATVFATHLFVGVGLLLLVLPRLWSAPRWRLLIPHVLAVVGLFAWIMLENQSRSPAVAVLIAIAVATVTRWKVVGAAFTVMIVLFGAATLSAEGTRIDEVGSGSTPGAEADTVQWRLSYWERNLPRVADNPINGIGLGRVEQINTAGQPPHNTAVQSIVEMGLFGAAAYTGFVVMLGRELVRALVRTRRTPWWDVAVVTTAMCLGYAFIGQFENLLTQVVTSGPMALFVGTALGSIRRYVDARP